MTDRHQTPEARTLAHVDAMGGWVHANYFDLEGPAAVRDVLLADGRLVEGRRDRTDTYEITSKGYAWLTTQGS